MGKWDSNEDEATYKLSVESAEKSVREFIGFYEIDTSRSDRDEEKIVETMFDDLSKAYRRGNLENKKDDNLGFCVVQYLKNGSTLTYRELGGKDRIVMEGFDNTRPYSRIYAILGKLSGLGEDAIMKLKGQDWKCAEALGLVFMMA